MQSRQCLMCKHYHSLHACEAFPERIPQEIFTGLHDHLKPFKVDNGIRWEEVEPTDLTGEPESGK